jgi:NADH-quinone oxidoreductase subunit D
MMKEYELFIGPNHPGATGNMSYRLWAEGDKVKRAETRVGYLHRGFEKLMEKRLWMQNVPLVCRICVPEPDINEAAYSMAVEDLMGWEIPERAKYIRTIILELARISSHLMTVGSIAASLGIYTAAQWGIGDRDYILDIFEEITGGRVYHIYIWPGGVRWDLPKNAKELITKVLDYLEKRKPMYDDLILNNKVFVRRAADVGVVPKDKAIEWGVTGPNLRAAGYKLDFRKLEPYAAYDKIDFEIPHYPKLGEYEVVSDGSDIYTRTAIRMLEIVQSIRIIRQALKDMPEGDVLLKQPQWFAWKVPAGYSYVRVESSKGEFGYFVVSDGGKKPVRVHVRGASYTHGINVLEAIAPGMNIADFAPTAFSLDVCAPEIER